MPATPPEGLPDDLIGRIVAGRYRVLSLLGSGAMGSVFLAEHTRMGRRDALKILARKLAEDPDALARFTREARNASFISHPNVCEIYDFGETEDGLPFIAMQFVDGETLHAAIEREDGLPVAQVVDIGVQITRALEVAHTRGIVHRDLKPQNVMLTRSIDGSQMVKVVDFGIAKAMTGDDEAQEVTRAGWVVGTPEYVSPEQLSGQQVDGRSDIYSLGIVLFKALTGDLPFQGSTWQEVMTARLTEAPRPLSTFRPELERHTALQRALETALARDPADRPATVAEFREALVTALEDRDDGTTGGQGLESGGHGAEGAARRPAAATAASEVPPTVAAPLGSAEGIRGPGDSHGPAPTATTGGRRFRWIGAVVGVVVLGAGAAYLGLPDAPDDAGDVPRAEGPAAGEDGAGAEPGGTGMEGPGADPGPGDELRTAEEGEAGSTAGTPDRTAAGDADATDATGSVTAGPVWTPAQADTVLLRQLAAIDDEDAGPSVVTAATDTARLVWEADGMRAAERGRAAYIMAQVLAGMGRTSEALVWAERAVDLVPDNRGYRGFRDLLRRGGA